MLKIYLTDLAAYNNGYLIGKWVDLPLEQNELNKEVQQILTDGSTACGYGETHEEWFITDYEWEDVKLFDMDEYANLEELNKKIQLLQELDPSQLKAVRFLLFEGITTDVVEAIEKADDVIVYEDTTILDRAYELLEECYDVEKLPSIIQNNIDYDGIARGLEMDGTYVVLDDDVFEYAG